MMLLMLYEFEKNTTGVDAIRMSLRMYMASLNSSSILLTDMLDYLIGLRQWGELQKINSNKYS